MGPTVLCNADALRCTVLHGRRFCAVQCGCSTALYGINIKRPAVRFNAALLHSFFIGLGCTAYRILSWIYKALSRHYRYSTQRHTGSQLVHVVGLGVFGNGAEVGEGHAVSSHSKHSRPEVNCSPASPLVDVLGRAEDHFGLPLLLGARSFCPYGP